MKYTVNVKVLPRPELLDPQGRVVGQSLPSLHIQNVLDVRVGKLIQLQVEAATAEEATSIAEQATKALLYNPIMEVYEIEIAG